MPGPLLFNNCDQLPLHYSSSYLYLPECSMDGMNTDAYDHLVEVSGGGS